MITAETSLIDVCFAVCTVLDATGVTAVLTGGSAAQYYAANQSESYDVDFMIVFEPGDAAGLEALQYLGYHYANDAYHHSENAYTIEFPKGPFAIGDDLVQHWEAVKRDREVLYVLDRTDCVRDRLAAFYLWDDRQSLTVARAVARSGPTDMERVRNWSEREQQTAKFLEFSTGMK